MKKLEINKLIESAEEIINDPQLDFVEEIEYPIQKIVTKGGNTFELTVKLTRPTKSVTIKIHPPIKIIPSERYFLVIKDDIGKFHYFNKNGTYDGFSMDLSHSTRNEIPKEEKDFMAEFVECDLCSHRWAAVYYHESEKLECPNCSNIGGFEIIPIKK